ncbi:SprB repeat-containing protein, partial [Tenacibaculum sp. S7007]
GGVEPYRYEWRKKGSTTIEGVLSSLEGVGSGTYELIVFDKNLNQATSEYILKEPSKLEISSVATQNVSCYGGEDGSIVLTVIGGVEPYSYSWKHSSASTQALTGLS